MSSEKSQPRNSANSSSSSGASFVVSFAILLSRILGLVREKVFAHYLGNSPAAGAFRAALRIPNFLQNLFGEGVLSASFIPVYARLHAEGDSDTARRVAGVVGAILSLVTTLLVLLGVLLTPWFVDLVAPGFEGELKELTIEIVRILFPGVGLLVFSAWCLGILNSHRKFFISYAAPVFWNLALIATLVIFGPSFDQNRLAIALAWGSVVGSALQLLVQLPFVFKFAGAIPFSFDQTLEPVRIVFRNLTPVIVSRGVVQISAYIDGMIASFLGAAAVASLGYAQTLYLLPISLFGMAVAAAELPEMSSTSGESEEARKKLRDRIVRGRKRIAFFVVPSAVALMFLGNFIIRILFQGGKFTSEDTLYVWYILIASAIGLLAATWGRLYSSAFYALRDTKTPLRFAILRVSLGVSLGLLFAFPLRPWISNLILMVPGLRVPVIADVELSLGAVGLSLSSAFAGWFEYSFLKSSLEKKIGKASVPFKYLAKLFSAALFSAAIAIAIQRLVLSQIDWPTIAERLRLDAMVPLVIFGISYLVFATIFKIDEVSSITRRLRR